MGNFVNPGNDAFRVALASSIYVDKTGLLEYTNKVTGTLQAYICNSRPRRFGKSITANMLTAYYSKGCDSETIFADLEISKSPDFKKISMMSFILMFNGAWNRPADRNMFFHILWRRQSVSLECITRVYCLII